MNSKKSDYMMVYAWEDQDAKGEIKFGDHYVPDSTYDEAIEHTEKYIRSSQSRLWHKFDEGRIKILRIWDVTEYSKSVGKFYKRSHMDDVIRNKVLINKFPGRSEVHRMDADDLVQRVAMHLARQKGSLPEAFLSTTQYRTAMQVLKMVEQGDRTILAELCARFGKTIWSTAVAMEIEDRPLVIVASYVKTVYSSFENELLKFKQFAEYTLVDAQDPQYQTKITKALINGKKVVCYLSMCGGRNRQSRIDWLFNLHTKRTVIVDEADLGVHRPKQSKPLIEARKEDDVVILATGSNSDRAVSDWNVDQMISVTYPELLLQKARTKRKLKNIRSKLNKFRVRPNLDLMIPDVEFYQMNLTKLVKKSMKEEKDLLPSWSKFTANPLKGKGFFTHMLQALFLGWNHDELNVDHQTMNIEPKKTRVAMMFFPSNMPVKMLPIIETIATQALPGFKVINISGSGNLSGRKINNRNAEAVVKEVVENAIKDEYSVLIIASMMAQRSFSIPEITELYLAYDQGSEGATIQKMSRTLTPYTLEKTGRVFSLSFDPNRDDKFDQAILETAKNWSKTQNISMKEAMYEVFKTINIFSCDEKGAVRITADTYLKKALARKSISRVIGRVANLKLLTPELITVLSEGNSSYLKSAKITKTDHGKTREPIPRPAKTQRQLDKELHLAREVVASVAEHIDVVIKSSKKKTIKGALNEIKGNAYEEDFVHQEFGISIDLIIDLFNQNVINKSMIELLHDCKC